MWPRRSPSAAASPWPRTPKAGTKKKPKAVGLNLGIANNKASQATVSRIEVFLAKNVKINAKGFATCSPAKVETEGEEACPAKSRIGKGTAEAVVGPEQSPLNFQVFFFVGSSKSLTIFLKQIDGDERRILTAKIGSAGGNKFGQKLTIDIPPNLQQPIPGLHASLADIDVKLEGTAGSGRKKHGIFESTGCTGGLHDFQTRLTYAPNPNPPSEPNSTATDTVACKK